MVKKRGLHQLTANFLLKCRFVGFSESSEKMCDLLVPLGPNSMLVTDYQNSSNSIKVLDWRETDRATGSFPTPRPLVWRRENKEKRACLSVLRAVGISNQNSGHCRQSA